MLHRITEQFTLVVIIDSAQFSLLIRKKSIYVLKFIAFPFCVISVHKARNIPDEQRLLNKMFRIYDHSVRPVYNATSNVVVKFGLTLIQIMDMVSFKKHNNIW